MGLGKNSVSQQFLNQTSECVDMERSSASAYDSSEVANKWLKDASEANGGKDNQLTQTLMNLVPLGMKFSITDSLLDNVEKIIFDAKNTKNVSKTNRNPVHGGVQAKGVTDAEKCKASNFNAISLTIGSWKEVSKREGDLVAKCYFAKKKLVWEILNGRLKSKFEIHWSDIAALRASIVANKPGILAVELGTQPAFFQEHDTEPRKHTQWKPSQDFTNGQALINRRHFLEFPPGVLDKHYEKLLQFDSRLSELSQIPFPSIACPYFPSVFYNIGIPETSLDFNGHGSNIAGPDSQPVQAYNQIHQPCLSIKDPTTTVMDFSSPLQEVLSSSQLVVNNPGSANTWSPPLSTSFGETQVLEDQIQQPLFTGFWDTQIMGDHIQRSFSTGSEETYHQIQQPFDTGFGETQVLGDQIQRPLSTDFWYTQIMGDHIQQSFSTDSRETNHQIQQPFDTGFGETQVLGNQIQQPLSTAFWDTQIMGNHIQQSFSTGSRETYHQIQQPFYTDFGETQVMGDQIQQPLSTCFRDTQIMGDHIQQPFSTGSRETYHQIQRPFYTSFGDPQVMRYQIQQSLSTDFRDAQIMRDHIQQPFATGSRETQVAGYQIQQPLYTGFREGQENPATSFQNNVSAPCDDREGARGAISEPQAYNNIMNPLVRFEELQAINDQNNYNALLSTASLNNNLHRQQ